MDKERPLFFNPEREIKVFDHPCPIDREALAVVRSSYDEPGDREILRARVHAKCNECGGIWALVATTTDPVWLISDVIERPDVPEEIREANRNMKRNRGGLEYVSCPTCGAWTALGNKAFPDNYLHLKKRDGDFYLCNICGGRYAIVGNGYGNREAVAPEQAPPKQLALM